MIVFRSFALPLFVSAVQAATGLEYIRVNNLPGSAHSCAEIFAETQLLPQPKITTRVFDRSKDTLVPNLSFPGQNFSERSIGMARNQSFEEQLKELRSLTHSTREQDTERLKAFLYFSPYPDVRRKVAEELAFRNDPVDLQALWMAQYLEEDPETHSHMARWAALGKYNSHKHNLKLQQEFFLEVRDDFFGPDLSISERATLKREVIEGRSPVFREEEAIMLELAKFERRAVLAYQKELETLRASVEFHRNSGNTLAQSVDELLLHLKLIEYTSLLKYIDRNRKSFEEGLIKRDLARVHDQKMGRVLEVIPNAQSINDTFFKAQVAPFENGTRAYVFESNGKLEVRRGWGGKNGEFGSFYSAPRFSTTLSREEAREILATPQNNDHSHWSLFKLPQNNFVIMGVTAAQRTSTGEEKSGWGVGGNGGELQYWRPGEFLLNGKTIKQAYLSGANVFMKLSPAQLSKKLREIQTSVIGRRHDFNFFKLMLDDSFAEIERLSLEGQPADQIASDSRAMEAYFLTWAQVSIKERWGYCQAGFEEGLRSPTKFMQLASDIARLEDEYEDLLLSIFRDRRNPYQESFLLTQSAFSDMKAYFLAQRNNAVSESNSPMREIYGLLELRSRAPKGRP